MSKCSPTYKAQCSGNEDAVRFPGCYDGNHLLNIAWCRDLCSCHETRILCPNFTPCSNLAVNATDICADRFIWSCGCAALEVEIGEQCAYRFKARNGFPLAFALGGTMH